MTTDKIFTLFNDLLDDLRVVFTEVTDVAQLRILQVKLGSQSQENKIKFVDSMSSTILSHEKIIKDRDITTVFEIKFFPDEKPYGEIINNFLKKLSEPGFLDKEEEDVIWKYMVKLLDMSRQYKKTK